MMSKNTEAEGSFYRKCAEILGIPYDYQPWVGRPPNRWNNRHAGNGRFPGFGTIKRFGPTSFHVSLRAPASINRMCKSEEEVFALLKPPT